MIAPNVRSVSRSTARITPVAVTRQISDALLKAGYTAARGAGFVGGLPGYFLSEVMVSTALRPERNSFPTT